MGGKHSNQKMTTQDLKNVQMNGEWQISTEKIRIDYVRQGIRYGSRFPEDGIFMDTLAAKDRLDQDKWRAGKQSP